MKSPKLGSLILTSLTCLNLTAMGADLRAPFTLESSETLPKGIWNPRFLSIFSPADSRFNGSGFSESLATPLNKNISFTDVINSKDLNSDKAAIRSLLQTIPETNTAGNITAEVKTNTQAFVPILAYGISENWTLALAAPIVHASLTVATGFVKSSDGQTLLDRAANSSSPYNADQARADLNNSFQNKLKTNGYNPLVNKDVTAPGDAKLISRYSLYKNQDQKLTLKNELTIPTGKSPNSAELIDLATGDGQWDMGATLVFDQKRIIKDLGASAYMGYTAQLPDSIEKRIPTASSTISADKETVKRNLGDIFSTGFAVDYEFSKIGTTLATGYHFQHQGRTTYSGKTYTLERYQLLESAVTSQTMHSLTVGAEFSTIDWFKQGKISVPMKALINYNIALAGRNVLNSDSVAAELVLFF